jgi:hypothetical protein
VVAQPWLDPSRYDDLPCYLTEPAVAGDSTLRRLRQGLARLQQPAAVSTRSAGPISVPLGGQPPRMSPVFARMVPLDRGQLPATLHAWWATRARSGAVTVLRRLQLGPPTCDEAAGWTMTGRVRRLTALHWVPVVIELWPVHEEFTRLTMTPQTNVLASRRYFRLGHHVLDRLSADLAEVTAPPDRSPG